ncbi:hypothetical protein KGM_208258 [Danaus plexippus plexippus]|uniref:FLYWCH-type domain-containing protein n=1 Tax=Danaus plexippus plexippus TaxID=278856 RepID=A0A212EXS7_DANPL|nr:hypothetical protein KGM_208258 [Danaus plexippus plexippus]
MASNGRTQMIYKDMKFYQQPEGQDRIRWRCTKRGCRAFYFTIAGIIVRSQERHNHEDSKKTSSNSSRLSTSSVKRLHVHEALCHQEENKMAVLCKDLFRKNSHH